MSRWQIKSIRSYVIQTLGVGGNYASRDPGHWIVDERQQIHCLAIRNERHYALEPHLPMLGLSSRLKHKTAPLGLRLAAADYLLAP